MNQPRNHRNILQNYPLPLSLQHSTLSPIFTTPLSTLELHGLYPDHNRFIPPDEAQWYKSINDLQLTVKNLPTQFQIPFLHMQSKYDFWSDWKKDLKTELHKYYQREAQNPTLDGQIGVGVGIIHDANDPISNPPQQFATIGSYGLQGHETHVVESNRMTDNDIFVQQPNPSSTTKVVEIDLVSSSSDSGGLVEINLVSTSNSSSDDEEHFLANQPQQASQPQQPSQPQPLFHHLSQPQQHPQQYHQYQYHQQQSQHHQHQPLVRHSAPQLSYPPLSIHPLSRTNLEDIEEDVDE